MSVNSKEITVLGVKYGSINEACNVFGIRHSTICDRLKRGQSIDDAFTKPINNKCNKRQIIDPYGIKHESFKAMCEYYNITYDAMYNRVYKKKMPLRCALSYAVKQKEDLTGKTILQKNRLKAIIINKSDKKINKKTIYTAMFEDGKIVNNITSYNFKTGIINHPTLKMHGKGNFYGFNTFGALLDLPIYKCVCEKCNLKELYTPQQMMEHNKLCTG